MRRKYCSEKCRQWAYYHRHLDAQRERSRQRHERRRGGSEETEPLGELQTDPPVGGRTDVTSTDGQVLADDERCHRPFSHGGVIELEETMSWKLALHTGSLGTLPLDVALRVARETAGTPSSFATSISRA